MDLAERDSFWQTLFMDETPLVADDDNEDDHDLTMGSGLLSPSMLSSPGSSSEPSQVPNSPMSSPSLLASSLVFVKPEPNEFEEAMSAATSSTTSSSSTTTTATSSTSSSASSSKSRAPKRTRRGAAAAKKDAVGNDVTPVTLTRDQMLHFSAQDYEDFIAAIMAQRTLSPDEEEVVRKQRRLVRNRESAQASRTRKRQRIEELEDQVRAITREKEAVVNELNQARGANLALQRTTEHLQNLVSRTPALAAAAAHAPSLIEHNPDTPNGAPDAADDAAFDPMPLVAVKKEKLRDLESDSDSATTTTTTTTTESPRRSTQSMGVMMLLVVLACGLFLNAHQPEHNAAASSSSSSSHSSMPRLAPLLLRHTPAYLDNWDSTSTSTSTSSSSSSSSSSSIPTTRSLYGEQEQEENLRSTSMLRKRSHTEMTATDQAPAQNSTTTSSSSPTEPHTTTTTTTTTTTNTNTTTTLVPRRPSHLVPSLLEQPEETAPAFQGTNNGGNVLQATIDAAMRQQTTAQAGSPLIALLIPPHLLSAALFNASQAGYQLLLPRDLPRAQGF